MDGNPRNCHICKAPCASNFKKVVELQDSSLEIYVHAKDEQQLARFVKKRETFIIHNKSSEDVDRPRYVGELCQYRTKCFQCKKVVQKVRELLQEFESIKGNQVIGVCEHCKSNSYNKCQRCEHIVNKYLSDKAVQKEERQKRLKIWLCNIRNLLQALLEGNFCEHKTAQEKISKIELENLLHQIKEPLLVNEISAELFPDCCDKKAIEYFKDSKDMIDEVMTKLKSHVPCCSNDSLYMSPPKSAMCICKYFDREPLRCLSPVKILEIPVAKPKRVFTPKPILKLKPILPPKPPKSVLCPKPIVTPKSAPKSRKPPLEKKFPTAFIEEVKPKNVSVPIPEVASLPAIVNSEKTDLTISSNNTMECNVSVSQVPKKMIYNNSLIPCNRVQKLEKSTKQSPLLFHVKDSFDCLYKRPVSSITDTKSTEEVKHNDKFTITNGIMCYQLSNRRFIENGITILPNIKTMRRTNIYKMEMAYESWFQRNKCSTKYYKTGEIVAVADEQGFGQWFYKNGAVALDFYRSEAPTSTSRYVVYSCNEGAVPWRQKPRTILAVFDDQGNGVVYDHEGNVRLKYNQSEGIVKDKKIGAPGRWMWHTLHEQPHLYHAYVEKYVSEIDLSMKSNMPADQPSDRQKTSEHTSMLVAELETYAREKLSKDFKVFKFLEIRSKSLKINDYFALRIIDQTNIRLLFRNGPTCLHLNIGTLLRSNEITDIVSEELTDVGTPYDRKPARSKSLADIQHTVERAKKISKRYNR